MKSCSLALLAFGMAHADPIVINDAALLSSFQRGLGDLAEKEAFPKADDLAKAVAEAPAKFSLPAGDPPTAAKDPTMSVFMLGSVYKCTKCDKWHMGGIATAWALSADGVMVTNHHVVAGAKGAVMGVSDRKGHLYPVTEVLAASERDDVAIFRVEGDGLQPLPLGPAAEIGSRVHVISHPDRRFFVQTFGDVSRYHLQPRPKDREGRLVMAITADYAKGSSGGPVLDPQGRVVGMVSSTQSIYYESNNGQPKGPLQMVFKNCVPVKSIRGLLDDPQPAEARSKAQR